MTRGCLIRPLCFLFMATVHLKIKGFFNFGTVMLSNSLKYVLYYCLLITVTAWSTSLLLWFLQFSVTGFFGRSISVQATMNHSKFLMGSLTIKFQMKMNGFHTVVVKRVCFYSLKSFLFYRTQLLSNNNVCQFIVP